MTLANGAGRRGVCAISTSCRCPPRPQKRARRRVKLCKPECPFCIAIICTDGRGSFCSGFCVGYRLNATDLTRPADPVSSSGSAAASAVGMC